MLIIFNRREQLDTSQGWFSSNSLISPPHNLLQPRSRPGADVALGGRDGKADGAGNLFEVLGLKLIGLIGKFADDAEHVLLEDGADGHGDGIVPKDGIVFGLDLVEVFVEVLALLCRKTNLDASVFLQAVVEGEELVAKDFEMVVQGLTVSFVQDIEPDEGFVQAIEEEAGEEAVFNAGHQVGDLLGSSRKDGGDTGLLDADVFPFRAAKVGDGLVLEALAEALGEVAEVLAEAGGKDVAFGLEEEALAVVLVKGLIHGGGTAIGRNKEESDGRRRGFRDAFALLLALVPLLFFSVIHLQLITLGPQFFVDGVYDSATEGESAFSAASTGGNEEVEVGEEFPAGIDGVDIG